MFLYPSMQAADILLMPSSWEGIPVTLMEATAAGLRPSSVGSRDALRLVPVESGADLAALILGRCFCPRSEMVSKRTCD